MPNTEPVYCDFETRSAASLRDLGGPRYLADPTTQVMMACFLVDGMMHVWLPAEVGVEPALEVAAAYKADCRFEVHFGQLPPPAMEAAVAGRTFVAHNASFDSRTWAKVSDLRPPWYDTVFTARQWALPGGIDKIGERLGMGGKVGSDVMLRLSKAKVFGGRVVYDPGKAGDWAALAKYCAKDVLVCREIAIRFPLREPALVEADQAINARGVPIDVGLLHALRKAWAETEAAAAQQLAAETDGELTADNVRSVPQVKEYLRRHGITLSSLEKKQLEAFFEDPEGADGWDPGGMRDSVAVQHVVSVLRLRQEATRATRGKVETAIRSAEQGRIRDTLVYHGAHTGRWTSRKVQFHNMARGLADYDSAAVLEHFDRTGELRPELGGQAGAAALATLFRPIVRASEGNTLIIVDFAQVEARCVGWLADDPGLLGPFSDQTRDVYCEMATRIFGEPVVRQDKDRRFVGKTTVLGCGYGMGETKFELMCRQGGIDLAKAGTSAAACVLAYRTGAKRVPLMWRWLSWKSMSLVGGPVGREPDFQLRAGSLHMDKGDLIMLLPSGREIRYRDARAEKESPGPALAAAIERSGRPVPDKITSVRYTHPRGWRNSLFGGLLCENLAQGACRDLLAGLIEATDDDGMVLHCHDEAVWEVPESMAEWWLHCLCNAASLAPRWADGFPLRAEGFAYKHYLKSAPKSALKADYMLGQEVE